MKRTYLDYNATAPLRPEAKTAMLEVMAQPHNASSVHSFGREARQIVEEAREKVAALTGAPAGQIIFNSGATEGNNTVLHHFAEEKILVSAIEHPSVIDAATNATHIPVTTDGVIDLGALEDLLKKEKPALVSVMLVNNETGVIQPISKIAELAKSQGALLHCDAVQAAGRIPINIETLRVDFLTLSAHKIGGPQGVGALVLGLCGITPTLLHGGGQEKKARAGTENVAAIAGFGAAAEQALSSLRGEAEAIQKSEMDCRVANAPRNDSIENMRNKLENGIKEISPKVVIYGKNVPRVSNTTMFSVPGTRAESLLMSLDLEGIAVSNGSACTSGSVQPSHVLEAMGAREEDSASALRISMGWDTKKADLDHFLAAWSKIYGRIKSNKGKQYA